MQQLEFTGMALKHFRECPCRSQQGTVQKRCPFEAEEQKLIKEVILMKEFMCQKQTEELWMVTDLLKAFSGQEIMFYKSWNMF